MKKIWYVLFFSMFLTFPLWGSRYKSYLPANAQKIAQTRISENRNSLPPTPSKEGKNGERDFWVLLCGFFMICGVAIVGSMYLDIDYKYIKNSEDGGWFDGGLE